MSKETCPVDTLGVDLEDRTPARGARRWGLMALGWVSVVAAIIGMVVPVWPTTCFLLLAAWAFGRSSHRMERWLYSNRLFGAYLKSYKEHGVLPRPVKWGSLTVLWLGIGGSLLIPGLPAWVRWGLVGIAMLISTHLVLLPTRVRDGACEHAPVSLSGD